MKYRLGEICEIVSGSTPKTSVAEYWDGDIKWITPAELTDESYIIEDSVRKLTELGVKKSGLTPFPAGTVILSSRAPIGKVAIAGCEMYCNQGFKNLICSDKINNKYLYWFLKGNTAFLNSLGRGATFKEISKGIVSDIEINVPDAESQNRAVSNLEKLSEIIKLRKNEISELDNLIKARFAELFGDPVADSRGWGQVPLKQMLESIRYGTSTPPVFAEDGYCFIRATNIKNGRIVNNDMKHISQYEADRLEKCKLAGGEVLIVRSGVNAGDTCVITDEYIGQYAGYDMILVMKDEMNPIFLNELINTGYMNRVVKPLTRRAAQPHLNSEQVQSFPIIKVPKYLQDEFADFVKQTNKSKLPEERQVRFIAKISQKPGRQISFCRFDRYDYN